MTPAQIVLFSLSGFMALIALFGGVWLFMTTPRKSAAKMQKFLTYRYAHRGLHGTGVAENSLTAFSRAVKAGFGIELDIRLAADGELVVFHDETLLRVCGEDKRVIDLTTEELRSYRLSGTDDYPPTLREVLELVGGRVPLLIEIKHGKGESGIAERFLEEIRDYRGEYIVESFNPRALKTVRRARPDLLLGQLSMRYSTIEKFRGKPAYMLMERMLLSFLVRPDFIAYETAGFKHGVLNRLKKNYGVPCIAWTVRSEGQEKEMLSDGFDTVIFEGYKPKVSRIKKGK